MEVQESSNRCVEFSRSIRHSGCGDVEQVVWCTELESGKHVFSGEKVTVGYIWTLKQWTD